MNTHDRILALPNRLLITGAPKAGKTTLAAEIAKTKGLKHLCTDPQRFCPAGVEGVEDELGWSEGSMLVAEKWLGGPLGMPGHMAIEGVAVPRALRKWRILNYGHPPPADRLLVLSPRGPLSLGQQQMADRVYAVLGDLEEWLAPILQWWET